MSSLSAAAENEMYPKKDSLVGGFNLFEKYQIGTISPSIGVKITHLWKHHVVWWFGTTKFLCWAITWSWMLAGNSFGSRHALPKTDVSFRGCSTHTHCIYILYIYIYCIYILYIYINIVYIYILYIYIYIVYIYIYGPYICIYIYASIFQRAVFEA